MFSLTQSPSNEKQPRFPSQLTDPQPPPPPPPPLKEAHQMASPSLRDAVGGLDRDPFVCLLGKLIGESRRLQNDPPALVPQEDLVAQHVVDALLPVSTETGGGPLVVRKVSYAEGRSNVIVEYPGTVPGRAISFVGMHMDVVPANPDEWVGCYGDCSPDAVKNCFSSLCFFMN